MAFDVMEIARLAMGTLPTSSGTLLTVPASTRYLVKDVMLISANGGSHKVTLLANGKTLIPPHIPINNVHLIQVNMVLNAGEIIAGHSLVSGVDYFISGGILT